MKLVVRRNGQADEVGVGPIDAETPVGALATSLGLAAAPGIVVDGVAFAATVTVEQAAVVEGSLIEPLDEGRVDDEPGEVLVELHQVGGLAAGGLLRLTAGRYDIGVAGPVRAPLTSGEVVAPLVRLVVTHDGALELHADAAAGAVIDGAPFAGRAVVTDEMIELGGVVFRATPAMDRRRQVAARTADGKVTLARPNRPRPPDVTDDAPAPPVTDGAVPTDDRQLATYLAEAGRRLARGWRGALGAARSAHPDVAELRARATVLAPSLWERRPGDHDHLVLSVGFGSQRWQPPSVGSTLAPELAVLLQAARDLPAVPVPVDLRDGAVGIAGPRSAALAVARWLVVQVATLHGPDDVRISVGADAVRADDWEWVTWLPHLSAPDDPAPSGIDHVSVVDVADASRRVAEPAPGHLLIVISETLDGLPAACSTLVSVGSEGTVVVHDRIPTRRDEGVAVGLSEPTARDVARQLAALRVDGGDERVQALTGTQID